MSRAGQLAIPAVFVLPTLLIFVYLLFETAKLSREKIRHQFAVDAAAFVEMTNYSDYLNRTAYVNGSFPHRIFKEAFSCDSDSSNYVERTDNGTHECLYDILYDMGAFPKYTGGDDSSADSKKEWTFAFADRCIDSNESGHPCTDTAKLNVAEPTFPSQFDLFTHARMKTLILSWEAVAGRSGDSSSGIYGIYYKVYSLLGSVQSSQQQVYERLTENFNFFRKSYYLNTGDCSSNVAQCGQQGLSAGHTSFNTHKLTTTMHYVHKIYFAARKFVGGLDPLQVVETPAPYISMPDPGLFQLATVDSASLKTIGNPGLDVYQGWDPAGGYFMKASEYKDYACDETSGQPCVHARIAAQCPKMKNGNNCIWPNPTPKYQTRLYP